MYIRITDFAGTYPKLHPTKLPDHAAQSCLNVMVEHGTLSPSREATTFDESNGFPYADFLSAIFFKHNGQTYKKFSNNLANYAFSPVHESYRLYWTTEDSNKKLMFSDWSVGNGVDEGELVTDGFDYIAGMQPPNVTDLVVSGMTPPPV